MTLRLEPFIVRNSPRMAESPVGHTIVTLKGELGPVSDIPCPYCQRLLLWAPPDSQAARVISVESSSPEEIRGMATTYPPGVLALLCRPCMAVFTVLEAPKGA